MTRMRWIFVAGVALFVLGVATGLGVLVHLGGSHDRILMEYRASQELNDMIDRYRSGGSETASQQVRGFGVFESNGTPLYLVGTVGPEAAPDILSSLRGGHASTEVSYLTDETLRLGRLSGAGYGREWNADSTPAEGAPTDSPGADSPGGESGGRAGPPRGRGGAGPTLWIIDYSVDAILAERRTRNMILVATAVAITALSIIVVYSGRSIRRTEQRAQRNESLAQLGNAARTIAHEIKNPLAAIRLQTSLLKRAYNTPEGTSSQLVSGALTALEDEVAHIATLVESIRSFLNNPRGVPTILNAVDEVRAIAQRAAKPFDISAPEEPVHVYIDRLRFQSIVTNLVANAHQASEEMNETNVPTPLPIVAISVVESATPSVVDISVIDAGPGIPKSVRNAVFDPFFTTRENGSGIGLAAVHAFTTAAGGTVSIEDRDDGGTAVTIRLPQATRPNEIERHTGVDA